MLLKLLVKIASENRCVYVKSLFHNFSISFSYKSTIYSLLLITKIRNCIPNSLSQAVLLCSFWFEIMSMPLTPWVYV